MTSVESPGIASDQRHRAPMDAIHLAKYPVMSTMKSVSPFGPDSTTMKPFSSNASPTAARRSAAFLHPRNWQGAVKRHGQAGRDAPSIAARELSNRSQSSELRHRPARVRPQVVSRDIWRSPSNHSANAAISSRSTTTSSPSNTTPVAGIARRCERSTGWPGRLVRELADRVGRAHVVGVQDEQRRDDRLIHIDRPGSASPLFLESGLLPSSRRWGGAVSRP